jgi:DNA-binding LacI/PurR family transcriptional regulator
VVSESGERVFTEPFFAGIVRGVSSALLETPMQLWLAMAQTQIERERVEHHLTNQHVDGVLLLSLHDADPLPTLLEERGLPTVLGGRPARMLHPNAQPAWFVDVDNVGGARQAVEHLFARGRRRVATIAGTQDMGAGLARLSGYKEAVRAAGGDLNPDLIAYGDFSEGSGTACMRRLLEVCPDLDAVFVASDLMAQGVLAALRRAGRRVPEDVAVGGFDDSPAATSASPALTTIRQPWDRISAEMVRVLLAQIGGEDPAAVILPTELVRRDST